MEHQVQQVFLEVQEHREVREQQEELDHLGVQVHQEHQVLIRVIQAVEVHLEGQVPQDQQEHQHQVLGQVNLDHPDRQEVPQHLMAEQLLHILEELQELLLLVQQKVLLLELEDLVELVVLVGQVARVARVVPAELVARVVQEAKVVMEQLHKKIPN